jgi:hypothetical protein
MSNLKKEFALQKNGVIGQKRNVLYLNYQINDGT